MSIVILWKYVDSFIKSLLLCERHYKYEETCYF